MRGGENTRESLCIEDRVEIKDSLGVTQKLNEDFENKNKVKIGKKWTK